MEAGVFKGNPMTNSLAIFEGYQIRRHIAESVDATGMEENKDAGKKGGGIAKKARLELEHKTGKSIITGKNYLPPKTNKALNEK